MKKICKQSTSVKALSIRPRLIELLIIDNHGVVDKAHVQMNKGKLNAYVLLENGYSMVKNTLVAEVEQVCETCNCKAPDVWNFNEKKANNFSYEGFIKAKTR